MNCNNYRSKFWFFKVLNFIYEQSPSPTCCFGSTTDCFEHFSQVDLKVAAVSDSGVWVHPNFHIS
ncbi:MAG: hypothetical protein Q27BPR15_12125 [Rhodobacter sp. CACIA14H1]|nr:MAG: hypothetical protein Q27BPR15_12125 [Rhodobacter sp. CACIA14H1]